MRQVPGKQRRGDEFARFPLFISLGFFFVKGIDPLLPVQGWGLGMRGTGFLKLRRDIRVGWGLARLRYFKQGLGGSCALACLFVFLCFL